MPRMDSPQPGNQLAKLLLIGEGKCGKTDLAGMAGGSGFNVLYLDGDVASQTIASLPIAARKNIYLLKCGDQIGEGGIRTTYAETFKRFVSHSTVVWNDTRQRLLDIRQDGMDGGQDEYWLIRPGKMDHTCVLVIEWTALAMSCMYWAANESGVDLGEVEERKEMRGVYQAAGEKLTQFLLLVQRAPCHVIALSHPQEFTKTQKPDNKTVGATKESDLKVLWTKMVPKSCSNNHALSMAKYFTDVAWLEPDMQGVRHVDFRVDRERISGGHFNERLRVGDRSKPSADDFSFAQLVKKLGGTIPTGGAPTDHWLTIQTGYQSGAVAKPSIILAKPATPSLVGITPAKPPVLQSQPASPVKGMLNLSGLKASGPVKA